MSSPGPEELRSVKRFTLEPPISATFGAADVTVSDFSEKGYQLEHATPLRLGAHARLTFVMPSGGRSVRIGGTVVWSRLSKKTAADGRLLYRSGIRADGEVEVMREVLDALLRSCLAQYDDRSLVRKKEREKEKARGRSGHAKPLASRPQIPVDQVLLIQQTREWFRVHPEETVKWYNRAKFSVPESEGPIHHRDEILAIWEYLDRTIDLRVISRVLEQKI